MEPKKYQLFISSTFRDLEKIRGGVSDAILRLLHFPVGMELFSADDDEQWEVIQETIKQSDYYVCILGQRYGSLSSSGKSFTEKEWDYAKELGVPILSFVRARSVATTPEERDSDPETVKKLEAFIDKVKANKMIDFWTSPDDLNQKVLTALVKIFSRKPRPGWIRTESGNVAEQMASLVEENRTLREAVEKLQAEAAHSTPDLAVRLRLGDETEIRLKLVPDELLALTPTPQIEEMDINSIPNQLRGAVSIADIHQYNAGLPSHSIVEEVFGEIRRIERGRATGATITLEVVNLGSAKAREVYVELEFPTSVWVIDKNDLADMKFPHLEMPVNPVERERDRRQTLARSVRSYGVEWGSLKSSPFATDALLRLSQGVDPRQNMTVDGNHVTLWMKDLLHTRMGIFRDLTLVPLTRCEDSISVSIICEEMGTKKDFTIPLTIE